MAASSNAQLNSWADTRVRPLADQITKLRYAIDAFLTDYAAQGISALITADGAANLEGAQDSRIPITGTQVVNFKAACLQLQVATETTNVTGVGSPPSTICDAIQVNGSPRG